MKAEEIFDSYVDGMKWSDIQHHLRRLRDCAKGNVFEIGVRTGISTAALLMGVRDHDGHVWSLDVVNCAELYDDPNWTFIQGHSVIDKWRVLAALPNKLDLLFIDSDHSYETTADELRIYGALVRKRRGVIFAHDTDLAWAKVRPAFDAYASDIRRKPTYHTYSYGLGELRP